MAILTNAPKKFVKKPSLCSQHKPVFTHPAQRTGCIAPKHGTGLVKTSWPTNSKHD
jgi:hypothetical protein